MVAHANKSVTTSRCKNNHARANHSVVRFDPSGQHQTIDLVIDGPTHWLTLQRLITKSLDGRPTSKITKPHDHSRAQNCDLIMDDLTNHHHKSPDFIARSTSTFVRSLKMGMTSQSSPDFQPGPNLADREAESKLLNHPVNWSIQITALAPLSGHFLSHLTDFFPGQFIILLSTSLTEIIVNPTRECPSFSNHVDFIFQGHVATAISGHPRSCRAEVLRNNPRLKNIHHLLKPPHAPRHLILTNRHAPRNRTLHHLLKRPTPHHSYLQRPNRPIPRPQSPISQIKRLLHLKATLPKHLIPRPITSRAHQLPVHHIVVRDTRRVHKARLISRLLDRRLKLGLLRLLPLNVEHHVFPSHEPELWGRVVEPSDKHDVPESIPVKPGPVGDHNLVLLSDLYVDQVNGLLLRVLAGAGQELEVGDEWHESVGDLRSFARGVKVDAEVGLGGCVSHGNYREPATVVVESRDVLSHGSGGDGPEIFRVGPDSRDYSFPVVVVRALRSDGVRQFWVGFVISSGHVSADRLVGDSRVEGPGSYVVGELLPVGVEELDDSDEG
ncbi:enoyl-CoA hydratase/isomerase [Striga asiatica]|uniref:Enoyl-CoA hydratase/isomerase n=1 Tax=Striga asiatica TaxID=4170 RepID=A0A5A7PW68_STRAF|nr:enoyl-CoA hydratase/isomerase [Striga asiatica]